MFNVGAVTTLEDGKVVTVEWLENKKKREAERAAALAAGETPAKTVSEEKESPKDADVNGEPAAAQDGVNPERLRMIEASGGSLPGTQTRANGDAAPVKKMSKSQQKKLAMYEERPEPPKPIRPDNIPLPEGETDWLALWDLDDAGVERRVVAEKKAKAAERKALRQKQKEGKAERRAARDERRKVYREKKQEWKEIKG